jgi:exonuclease SbcC
MKFPSFLRKARWLSKDSATRLLGVLHDSDSELVASLGRLAREDTDAGVRLAAMKRLADPGIAQGISHDDADPAVRAQARALWLDLLTGTHASAPPLSQRVRLLKAQDESELIEHIARRAREPELRRAALERVTRPALLFDRAVEDPDADIRIGLVERISDEAQLARLAERARKTDKQVSRRARERIEILRIARGDGATLEQRARALCEQLEQLLREPRHLDVETDIATRWADVETAAPEALRARFRAAQALLIVSRAPPSAKPAAVADLPDVTPVDEAAASDGPEIGAPTEPEVDATEIDTKVDSVIAPLIAQARFAASLDEANAERKQRHERHQALLGELKDALTAIDVAIDSGASAQAHAAKMRADDLRRSIDAPLPPAVAQQAAAIETRYAELSRWQHWADNHRRRQLCEEIEALATTGIHPDAVATRVREAQLEWTRLDAIEGRDAAKPGGIARQFHAACRAALAPTQAYFRKRQELRQSHAQLVTTLLDRVGAIGEDSTDWTAISGLRRELVEALRGLDSVEPRDRKALAQRLKDALTGLDARVARRDEEVGRAKSALIAQAEALGQGTPQRGAVAAARELQQRWQGAGNGRRAKDQAQWNAFRAAIDAVFAKLDSERNERSARDAEERTQAEATCAEMEAFVHLEVPPERSAVARVQSAWNALRVRDDALARRFADAQMTLQDAAARHERTRRHAQYDIWRERYRLCRAIEHSPVDTAQLQVEWQALPQGEIAAAELAARFEAAPPTADEATDDDVEAFHDVLIAIEVLAGIESPAEDLERRRALQVDRLSARLRSSAVVVPTEQELAELLVRWTSLQARSNELDQRLERALAGVLETLP